ncbi:pyridoxine 5'-phosphate synthase [Paludibacterium yongneupense]|uniref:pyridoxine 5'-phosphate synthase n=1 Tax=Paludibacterium yongneupense TaxID=400061 RepID=UPI00041E2B04|nr:pyridoxine 5'-phosphate synthase [Paludibacterium yongneupense]
MPTQLSVNLNKIALIRNARGHDYPSVTAFARLALASGAHGVTIHPRPDQRHARFDDIAPLSAVVAEFPGSELNIEGYPTPEFIAAVIAARPAQCTLVPDEPGQLTSDHGWDARRHAGFLREVCARLRDAGIRVSLFMDPDPSQIEAVPPIGVDRIELYTEAYAADPSPEALAVYREAARVASGLGLELNAGHDLNLNNLAGFLSIPGILEVSIGHALTVEALESGFAQTIRSYLEILRRAA